MRKNEARSFLVVRCGLLLLTCAAVPATAQEPGVPITKKRADAVIIDRSRKKTLTPSTEDKVGKRIAAEEGLLPPDHVEPLSPNTIRVRIRYKEELGYNEDHDTYVTKVRFHARRAKSERRFWWQARRAHSAAIG